MRKLLLSFLFQIDSLATDRFVFWGVVQAEIYETMFKYGVREAGNEEIRWPLLPVGAWLALIALLVWIFTVIKDPRFQQSGRGFSKLMVGKW